MPKVLELRWNGQNLWKVKTTPKLTQGIENLNSSIYIREIEFAVKTLPQKKHAGPAGLNGEFYQTFKKNNTNSK